MPISINGKIADIPQGREVTDEAKPEPRGEEGGDTTR
jgi:hypothetical protein